MSQNKLSLFLLLYIANVTLAQNPAVCIDLPALLGNRLWGFAVAKIIATELNYDLYCKSIWGFPYTYSYNPAAPKNNFSWQKCTDGFSMQDVINNKAPRNIRLNGYFQNYQYIKNYTDIIRNEWLKIDPEMLYDIDPNDIVIHIRFHVGKAPIKFEYYKEALSMAKYNRVYICTDEPYHPFLKNFEPYNPIIKSKESFESYFHNISWDETTKRNIDDFAFIASFNKIIISYSTYAWWAAFLSNATEIYAPYSKTGHTHYGKVDETRYTYIETNISLKSQEPC